MKLDSDPLLSDCANLLLRRQLQNVVNDAAEVRDKARALVGFVHEIVSVAARGNLFSVLDAAERWGVVEWDEVKPGLIWV